MADGEKPRTWESDSFVGGALCLDFANTVGGTHKERAPDYLRSYADLLAWGRAAGAVEAVDAAFLEWRAEREPERAAQALARALELREAIYRLLSAKAAGVPADDADLASLNRAVLRGLEHAAIEPEGAGFAWRWAGDADDLERPLWPVLRSAMALMTGPELALLRECGRCSWLFLDRSKNKRRRWCKMEACGNRAKSQRHYRRATGRGASSRTS
ncbi:MAG: CGNR zinc finger domain-containing protein [Kiloniellales bacterium]